MGNSAARASAQAACATALAQMSPTTRRALEAIHGSDVSKMAILTCRTISSHGLKKRR